MKTRLDGRRQDVAADLETSVDRIHASPTRPPPGRIEKMKREDEDTTRDVIRAGMNDAEINPDATRTGVRRDGKARASDEEEGALFFCKYYHLRSQESSAASQIDHDECTLLFPRSGSHGTHA